MSHQVVDLTCYGCGARVEVGQQECSWCHKPVVISTFNSVHSMPIPQLNKYANEFRKALDDDPENRALNNSVAMCYLKLKLYEKALPAFEKAVAENFDNSESFFYAAVCLLKGKKAFLASRQSIDKIEEYINAAIMIEPRGIYYYFLAYVKYDYFSRKCYKTVPTYQEALTLAQQTGVSEYDISQLYAILNVERPGCL